MSLLCSQLGLLPPSGQKSVFAGLRSQKKRNYCTFIPAQVNFCAVWHIKGLIWNINKEWKVYLHEVIFSPSNELNLSKGGSLCCVITPNKPEGPAKIRNDRDEEGIWEGEVGVERPLSQSLFTSYHLANKRKVEWRDTGPSAVRTPVGNGDSD